MVYFLCHKIMTEFDSTVITKHSFSPQEKPFFSRLYFQRNTVKMLGFVLTLNKKIKHILKRDRLSTAVLQSLEAFPHSHSFIRPVVVMSKLSSLWLASRTD